MASRATRTRKSAEERREEIVALAIEQFALGGYKGTSTDAIAREAGISQPYLFRLFKTKRELFLACNEVSEARILETFRAAARGRAEGGARSRRWAAPTSSCWPTRPGCCSRCRATPPARIP